MDETTESLKASNSERITRLARQQVPVLGLLEGYHTRLLEHLVGDELPEVKRQHELWVANELDRIESEAARRRLGVRTDTN